LSSKSDLIGLLNLVLLADLSVDSSLELLDLFLLDKKLLLLLEGLDLLFDDLNFLGLFCGLLFLGIDDDLSHSDLLFDLFLLDGSLLKTLRSEGQFSSGGSLLDNDILSLGGHSLSFLLVRSDVSGNLIN